MKKLLNKFPLLFAILVGIAVIVFFMSIDGPVRMPVLLIWIPELFGWEVFSAFMGLVIGTASFLFFKGGADEHA